MKQFFWWIIFISFLPSFSLGQSLEQTSRLAGEQYNAGNYKDAIELYNRVIFFNATESNAYFYRQVANCHFKVGEYKQAGKNYSLAGLQESSDSLRIEDNFNTAISLLCQKEFNLALIELLSLQTNSQDQERRKSFYLAAIYYEQGNYSAAYPLFASCLGDASDVQRVEFEKLYKKSFHIKHQEKLAYLSVFPGLGQFVLGDPRNGAVSLGVNGMFIYLFTVTATNYSLFSAIITVFPWFSRYYIGGIKNAKRSAEKKRLRKKYKLKTEVLDFLQKNQ